MGWGATSTDRLGCSNGVLMNGENAWLGSRSNLASGCWMHGWVDGDCCSESLDGKERKSSNLNIHDGRGWGRVYPDSTHSFE